VNIDLPQVLSFISGVAGLTAAYGAYRKLSLEGRDSVISNFQKITGEQRSEIDRLIKRNAELEAQVVEAQRVLELRIDTLNKEHSRAIEALTARMHEQEQTIVDQAGKIRILEKNQEARLRGDHG
jgi:cell division protein FtsB